MARKGTQSKADLASFDRADTTLLDLGATDPPLDPPAALGMAHQIGQRDYRELKQEVGLGHFEGRSWRGLNHHVTLCLAAYGFLVRERSLFPPRHPGPQLPGNQHPGPPGPP